MPLDLKKIKKQFSIIGDSKYLDRALEVACLVANTDLSVLITGENGTGKDVFSKIIHTYSSRASKRLIAINCGAIPEGTVDSELFGHKKGAFTGATEERKGYFEEADGGTIFLDEIGDLPLHSQTKLLRLLEQGEIIKVGSSKIQNVDVRIIAATNVDLQDKIRKGKFREDLFYRLNTVPITIPPLRDRGDDIYKIFLKFATDFSEKYKSPTLNLTDEAKKELIFYNFPGNIRELKNIVEHLSIITQGNIVTKEIIDEILPKKNSSLPIKSELEEDNEKKILYKAILQLKSDVDLLKQLFAENFNSKKNSDINSREQKNETLILKDSENLNIKKFLDK